MSLSAIGLPELIMLSLAALPLVAVLWIISRLVRRPAKP